MDQYLLSAIIFLPALGALLLLLFPRESNNAIRWFSFLVSIGALLLSLMLLPGWRDDGTFKLQEKYAWIPQLGINYHLGIDGISLWLVILTTLLSAIAVLSTFSAVQHRVKEFMISILLLETGMLGVFCALDLVLFYVFWEAMLVPMYLLIGIWGGERRIYAAIKFFIYTMIGSVLMFVAILVMHYEYLRQFNGQLSDSWNLLQMYNLAISPEMQGWLFLAFGLAFAIKVPMWPFHTWLPDAHVEAPTAGSVTLAAVLLKMGTYGFIRFNLPLFPDASISFVPLMVTLAIIGIIYGAIVAAVQPDVKKLVAYSSVSHLGFVVLGIFAAISVTDANIHSRIAGLGGGLIQNLSHGLSTGALFLIVGILYERRHTRLISEYGGIWKVMPVFAAIFAITMFSSIGLPGLNGFVGEFMVLWSAFAANPWYGALAATGVVLSAIYMLWMFQRVMYGTIKNEENKKLRDLNTREFAYLVPLVVLMFAMGFWPKLVLDRMEPSIRATLSRVAMRVQDPRHNVPQFMELYEHPYVEARR